MPSGSFVLHMARPRIPVEGDAASRQKGMAERYTSEAPTDSALARSSAFLRAASLSLKDPTW